MSALATMTKKQMARPTRRARHLILAGAFAGLACSNANDAPRQAVTSAGSAGALAQSAGVGGDATRAGESGSGGLAMGNAGESGGGMSSASGGTSSGGTSSGGTSSGGTSSGGTSSGGTSSGGTSAAGSAGALGSSPLEPPLRDSASKVPISQPASGYTVEGNFAYGPLTAQRLDVLYPNGAGPKATTTLPVVLMFHGGAWIHSYTNDYGSGKDHMSTFFNRYLAHGFIVFNAEYRVNDNTPDGAPAPAAVQDALLAASWCWKYLDYFHGDRSKFVVTGASAGGHLALMVGMTTPAAMLGPTSPSDFEIAAIVSGYGPADIEAEIDAVAKDWIPSNLPNRAAIAKEVNPITYVRKDVPPLIVVQGANDTTAPVKDSQHLVSLLDAAGADASIHLVAGAGHGFTDSTWPDAEMAMFDWLSARNLGNK